MPPRVLVVVLAGSGTRDVARTIDSVVRQADVDRELVVVCAEGWEHASFAAAAARRAGGRLVAAAGDLYEALPDLAAGSNAAAACLVPAGFRLDAGCLRECARRLDEDRTTRGIAPRVRIESADATRSVDLRTVASFVDLIAEPSAAPRVLLVRRVVLTSGAPLEGMYPLAVQCAFEGGLAVASDACAACDAAGPAWRGSPEPERLAEYRRVIARHRGAIENEMAAVLTRREIAFARLRDEHRRALARRDEGLAHLDEERAAAAHHHAWLTHNGLDAFDWGDLRRTDPVSRDWGYDRGTPVDRPYIEAFLAAHSSDIHGTVLEVQEPDFTARFGGPRVRQRVVLDLDNRNQRATVIADLRHAPQVSSETFDGIVLTQTLHVIDDMRAALQECVRILKPGGVLLATFPAASRVCLEYGERGDLWRTTAAGARELVEQAFGVGNVDTAAYGNVMTNVAFLEGLAASELTAEELALTDPYFPAVTGVRAVKRSAEAARRDRRGAVLLYHRIAAGTHDLNVAPPVFRDQIAWLARQCSVVPLEQLLEGREADLPPNAVALTFDDGYVDNLTAAAPLLADAGLPATFFVTTRWLEEPGEYWWDLLDRTMGPGLDLPPVWRVSDAVLSDLRLATAEERRAARGRLHDRLVHASFADREALVAQLRALAGGTARYCPMTADEICAIAAIPGMSLGVHTVNHLALPDQADETVRREIEDCQATLGRLTGRAPAVLAYPYGASDASSAAIVRESFGWGLTCEGSHVPVSFDAARVPRVQIGAWDPPEFERRVLALFDASDIRKNSA